MVRVYATRSRRSPGPRKRCPDCGRRGMTAPRLVVAAGVAVWVSRCIYCEHRTLTPGEVQPRPPPTKR